jgi:hypothetical protein
MATVSGYLAWNNALAARFFRPEAAGQQVYLFVTEDAIEEVGRPLGGGVDDFIAALRAGPPGVTRTGHCQRALQVAERWRSRDTSYPPYLAYLGLFVLAGGHEGDFDPRSYYPRLWELLGEPDAGTPPSFDRMQELWDDLERWSVRDRQGQLGIFEARIVSGKIHIGLPLGQTVLTEAERQVLPRIFADAGLDPDCPPSDRELRRALALHGRQLLRARTIRALEGGTGSFEGALLDVVSDDFLDWDGTATGPPGTAAAGQEVHAGLRLCLSIDRVAGRARAVLRCRSRKPLPDDGLVVPALDGNGQITCTEFVPGWSSPLTRADTASELVPPSSAWRRGLTLRDVGHGWALRLRPARLRAFIDGAVDALPGVIEVPELPKRHPFLLAFAQADWPALQPWAESDCAGFKRLDLTSGLPPGWALAAIDEARTDVGARRADPELGFPDRRSLRLVGGIRGAAGNTFFPFAPPRLVLDGAEDGDSVFCNGLLLQEEPSASGSYAVPPDMPTDARIGVEVRNRDEVVKRRSFYLVSGFPWQVDHPLVLFDRYGRRSAGDHAIAGAAMPDFAVGSLRPDPLRTPGLSPRAQQVFFLGRSPGQIVDWPKEPLPEEWEPVWAVPFARRGRALYCGTSLEAAVPFRERHANRKRAELWRRVLWRWRARVTRPQEPALKALWRQYQEAARDA